MADLMIRTEAGEIPGLKSARATRNLLAVAVLLGVVSGTVACSSAGETGGGTGGAGTRIELTNEVLMPGVTRLGMNLGDQTFYDSGQMMRNLVFRNPGFEGLSYRSILHCSLTLAACTDATGGIQWPVGFWNGAHYAVLDRPVGNGGPEVSGTIGASQPIAGGYQVVPAKGGGALMARDWVSVSKETAGDPAAGWWTHLEGGASLLAERADLSAGAAGKQALRVEAAGSGQSGTVSSYFDSTEGQRFLAFHGRYRVRFRAKFLTGEKRLHVDFFRTGSAPFLSHDFVPGAGQGNGGWADYEFEFEADDAAQQKPASAELRFTVRGASLLLDDVSLEAVQTAGNPTAFRDEVVQALRELHPGVLRLMSSHAGLGATVDNLLAPPFARQRAGYSVWATGMDDIPVGIPEFLELCQTVGAEPWIVLPTAMSEGEARLLAEYLTQPAATAGGRLRAAGGHSTPWTESFARIHLELGNEAWNSGFAGESMDDPGAYGRRADRVFRVLRGAAGSGGSRLDLVVNAQTGTQWAPTDRNRVLFGEARAADTLAIAPYLMHQVDQVATPEQLYGTLLAEPEEMSRDGVVAQAAGVAGARKLAVYEVNLHTTEGTVPEAVLGRFTPSVAAGIAVSDHMLRMLRDHQARAQMIFSLSQFEFRRSDQKNVRLWGSVVDMGPTNRRRPQFLAEALVNRAMHGDLVRVRIEGSDPTHDVPAGNDGVKLAGAHELDAYGFTDRTGGRISHALVVFNLSVEGAHTVTLAGVMPGMAVTYQRLWAADPGATNEAETLVLPSSGTTQGGQVVLPACSLSVFEWQE